jgi:hypothetical protein
MATNASYSHWTLSTGWTTVIDVAILCSLPFHHFISMTFLSLVVSSTSSFSSKTFPRLCPMLPCFLGCGVQTLHNWHWRSPASLSSSSRRLRRYDQPSHPCHYPLSLAPIFNCTPFPTVVLSAGGISMCGKRMGENSLDEESKSHPRPMVENSMKGGAEKMSKRQIGHPPTCKIKRV